MVKIIVVGQGGIETKEEYLNRRLTDTEQRRAASIGRKLKRELPGREYKLFSSDISRPRQAAEIIAGNLSLDVAEEKRLRGICSGYEQESWQGFYQRLSSCLDVICGEDKGENLIFVTHGCCLTYTAAWWAKALSASYGEDYIMARPSVTVMLLSDMKRAVPAS